MGATRGSALAAVHHASLLPCSLDPEPLLKANEGCLWAISQAHTRLAALWPGGCTSQVAIAYSSESTESQAAAT